MDTHLNTYLERWQRALRKRKHVGYRNIQSRIIYEREIKQCFLEQTMETQTGIGTETDTETETERYIKVLQQSKRKQSK